MNLFFLSSNEALTKTHTKNNNQITTQNYPMMKYFTSHQETINTIEEFYAAITNHAQQGHCLLKGELQKPLNNEPRNNSTNRLALTNWMVFDLDGAEYLCAEDFISELPEEFHHVSYIEQLSASAGIKDGLKTHLFFLLAQPVSPAYLKLFLTHLNLTNPILQDTITLNPGGLSLGYTLDTGINANATPIYIAPPTCIGFDDPIPNRITLHIKHNGKTNYKFNTLDQSSVENSAKDYLKQLRKNRGLPKKTAKINTVGNTEVFTNVDPTILAGEPFEERGFIYLPINPNNKYTYYHPVDNATLIYNFRGEPAAKTEQLLPEYWTSLCAPQTQLSSTTSNQRHVLIFRDFKTDTYYNGWSSDNYVEINPTKNKDRLRDFATQNNTFMPNPIPDWELDFDPTSEISIDISKQYLNLFRFSSYLKEAIHNPKKISRIPPTIYSVIDSVVGNDQTCLEHFINWLAYIVQKRQKTKTAWVFQGIEGTGKGILFHLILRPILGHQYCQEKLLKDLLDNFNDWARESLLIFFDETKHFRRSDAQKNIPNLVKNLITEPVQSIRAMRTNPAQFNSYSNALFATNESDSLYISESDRRFNVCPEQNKPFIPPTNLEKLIENELQDFAHFLYQFPVVEEAVRTVLNNHAKAKLRTNASSEYEIFFREFRKGNFNYFAELYEDNLGMITGLAKTLQHIIEAWTVRWIEKTDDYVYIRRDELLTIYNVALNTNDTTPKKFVHALHKNGIQTERQHLDQKIKGHIPGLSDPWGVTRVIPITWQNGLDTIESLYNFIKEREKSHETRNSPGSNKN